MLKYLQEYVIKDSYTDRPVFNGRRYREGRVVRVERGDRVITLEKLALDEDEPVPSERNWPWLGQLITDDDRNGKKIRLYPSEVEIEGQVPPTPRVTITSTGISSTDWIQAEWHIPPPQSYVNTADSILREDNE